MKWVSAVSERPSLEAAVAEVAVSAQIRLGELKPDLVMVFVSEHHAEHWDHLPDAIAAAMDCPVVLGCTSGGVIGGGHEVEQRPAIALVAAHLPGVALKPFHLDTQEVPNPLVAPGFWSRRLGLTAEEAPRFLLLPDPMTCHVQMLLEGLDRAFPGAVKLGGLASGAQGTGRHGLLLNGSSFRRGVVGVAMTGNVIVDALVAQGCRPIGLPMFVTACHRNILLELDGRPVLSVIRELHQGLGPRDQQLFRSSLFLGVVMREDEQVYHHGDFLIRNLLGVDEDTQGLRVGTLLRPNQVVQFHLRDAQTSSEDLSLLLARYREGLPEGVAPCGGVMFSCLGRGMHLYGEPDHDMTILREELGELAIGGFFGNGEVGPVQGATFLHGYTSVMGLFRPLDV
ncbi:MAG: hypothetical protein CMH57_07820 [Myxococcales bacterium]|nr:hypothetical protein [Myxococcales bacterium]